MQAPPVPDNETERLAALCELHILDTPPEARFDRVTRIAQALFGVPIALVSLIDADRQWFKSRQGLAARETPRSMSFCGHSILHDGMFMVADALDDPRFADNPLVTGPPRIRFYAGVPLLSRGRLPLGTLCLIDTRPRTLSDEQAAQLADLAKIVEEELIKDQLNNITSLYHAEQARSREGDRLLRSIADNTPGMLGYWTRELRCTFANRDYLTWFGRTPEQMQGIHIRELMGEELFGKNEPYIRAVLDGEDQQFERTLTKPNGETGHTLARYIAHRVDGEVAGFFVLVSDITSIKLVHEQLRQSEARNQAVISAIPDAIFMHGRDGVFLDCHAAAPAHALPPAGAAPQRHVADAPPPGAAGLLTRACADALERRAMQEVRYALPGAGGGERYFEARVVPCSESAVISILRDVTDRELDRRNRESYTARLSDRLQLSEADLREREQALVLAADAANLGVWILDCARDELRPSEQWRALFGFPPSQRLNAASLLQRVHPDDLSRRSEALAAAPPACGFCESVYRIVLPGGQLRWISSRWRVESDRQGRPLAMRGVSVDITARKQAELDMQQKQSEIAHLSRVTMLGELSGALAHELNQPLTAILSNAQAAQRFLARDGCDLDEVSNILQDIVDEDKRAGEVIRRLRRLFDKGDTLRQRVDANELVAEVAHILRNDLINRGITLKTELAAAAPAVDADRVQLQQVLINLVMNAADAMASTAGPDRFIVLRTAPADGGAVRISVVDRGTGIPDASMDCIFEPFYTTKKGGMGLGLSICRNIAAANGGRLWSENNPGRGASFHVLVAAPAGARAAP